MRYRSARRHSHRFARAMVTSAGSLRQRYAPNGKVPEQQGEFVPRSCFISFKFEDVSYKEHLQNELHIDMIDVSVDVEIDSTSNDQIIEKIRKDHLGTSEVTIHLIGAHSAESAGKAEQKFIKRELQLSLYNGSERAPTGNRNGILGVVLPEVEDHVFQGQHRCSECNRLHRTVNVNSTTIVEFTRNYYATPLPAGQCAWGEQDRYCVLVRWSDFCRDPEGWIEQAFQKTKSAVAEKVVVFPKAGWT